MKRWLVMGILSGALLLALWAAAQEAKQPAAQPASQAAPQAAGQQGAGQSQEEMGYWDKFKMMFVNWDDDKHQDNSSGKTEVVGLRGLNIEQAMSSGYDWQGVRRVEDYQVAPDQVKSFLQQGHLGPYK